MDGGLMNDVRDSHQSLKNMVQSLGELQDEVKMTDDVIQSMIDYNVNDTLSTLSLRNNYVEIQIGDVSEDVRRNAVVNVRNFTREIDYRDVKNVLLDYDGNADISSIGSYLDLDYLLIKKCGHFLMVQYFTIQYSRNNSI